MSFEPAPVSFEDAPASFHLAHFPSKGSRLWPERVAVIWDAGCSSRTFRELDLRVGRLVTVMREAAVVPGSRVGILAPNCPEFFEVFFACAQLGAAMVPLNVRLSAREVAYQVGDSGMTHAFVHPELEDLARAGGVAELRRWRIGSEYDEAVLGAKVSRVEPRSDSADVVCQMYTSGTTGDAKGCMQSAGAWLASALNFGQGLRLPRHASVASWAPYFHAFGFGIALSHLLVGGTVGVTSGEVDYWPTFDACEPYTMVPMRSLPPDGEPRHSVRVVIGQAGQYRPQFREFLKLFLPNGEYFGIYGLTEATNIVMLSSLQDEIDHPGALGTPLPGVDVMVADASGSAVRPGQVGELLFRGAQMCSGYWHNDAATSQLFSGGWMHTGDLASLGSDGAICFQDRSKDMIKSGGENVFSAEVERALIASPLVADVAVLGVPDERWTEVVKAVVVLTDPSTASLVALDRHCREHMAAYKRPRLYEVVRELPRNHTNKVMKSLLRAEHDPVRCTAIEGFAERGE